jgi:hypothetical protein
MNLGQVDDDCTNNIFHDRETRPNRDIQSCSDLEHEKELDGLGKL